MATLLNPPGAPGPSHLGAWEKNPARAPVPLHLWHLASLDAPTVALVWAAALAWAAHTQLRPAAAVILALVVWVIYVVDRLLDVRKAAGKLLRERHFFHWRHRRVLLPLCAAAALAAAALVLLKLPARALRPDALAAAVTLGWLLCVHSRFRLPERLYQAAVGLIFAAGCALPVWTRLGAAHWRAFPIVPALGFAALAWLNLHAIHQWESPRLKPQVRLPAAVVAIVALALAAFAAPRAAALLAAQAAAALLLALLDRTRSRLSPLTLRAAADLVLLTPLLLAPVAFFFP